MVRLKARYLLCEVCVSQRSKLQLLEEKAIFQAVKAAVAKAHGEYGAALFSIGSKVTYLNAYTGVVMLRFRKAFYQLLWSALPFINSIGPQGKKVPCFFNCIYVGGTIKTCQKFLVRYDRQQLYRMLPHCKTGAEKHEVRRAVQTCSHSFYKATQQEHEDDDGGEEGKEEETIVL